MMYDAIVSIIGGIVVGCVFLGVAMLVRRKRTFHPRGDAADSTPPCWPYGWHDE